MKLSEPIRSANEAVKLLKQAIPKGKIGLQECMVVLPLDGQYRVVGRAILAAMGTANNVEIAPRDVFREAIKRNSIAIIVAHNHPSGKLDPSEQDKILALKLNEVGNLLGVQVLDNIIIGKDGYSAMSEGGWNDERVKSGEGSAVFAFDGML